MDRLGDGRKLRRGSIKPSSHTPTVCCYYDIGDTLRALMKIGLNLIAALCPNTPVDHESFALPVRVIRGPVQILPPALVAGGFVHSEDVEAIKGNANEHTFRLMYVDGTWHVFSCFFGGDIGAYVQVPGPNREEWNCADIVAPINSKDWRHSTRRTLPMMNKVRIEWRDVSKVIPCFKTQYSAALMRVEKVRKK
jgi:hypothetical protein